MIEFLSILIGSIIVTIAGAASPGPVLALTIPESLKYGYIAGPLIIFGHAFDEFLIIILSLFGFQYLLTIKEVSVGIAYFGGLSLIIFGFWFIINSRSMEINLYNKHNLQSTHRYELIFGGALTSFSNPYFSLWWITLGLPIMYKSIELGGLLGSFIFIAGHWSVDFSWYGVVSYSVSKGRKILRGKFFKWIIIAGGIFMIFFGFCFLLYAQ